MKTMYLYSTLKFTLISLSVLASTPTLIEFINNLSNLGNLNPLMPGGNKKVTHT